MLETTASAARVVGWVEARPDGGFGHGLSRAETHHLEGGIVDDATGWVQWQGFWQAKCRVGSEVTRNTVDGISPTCLALSHCMI